MGSNLSTTMPLTRLHQFKNTLIVAFLCLAIGAGAGFYLKGRLVKANQVEKVEQAIEKTADNIIEANKASEQIEEKAEETKQAVRIVTKTVVQRVKKVEKVYECQNTEVAQASNGSSGAYVWNLDVGTVRMLNDARAGRTPDSTAGSDAESKAPSGLAPSQFIENDLQIVEQYHDLATRHDALVDWVNSVLMKQAGQ